MGINIYKIKRSGKRNYAHFDKRLGLVETYKYVSNPTNIISHSFYPFIFYEKKINKYNKKNGIDPKKRPICYASHIDRCIFQYYSYILNEKYNDVVNEMNIDKCAIAYRTNIYKSNIHFAKEVFNFIKRSNNAIIMVGDFKGFFDNLDHKYLKIQLCKLFGKEILSGDMYAIYKNMIRFSKWRLEDILKINSLRNTPTDIKKLNTYDTVMSVETFRNLKKKCIIKNENNYGIPQGSPLSGIFSNIYMMDFDKKISKLAESNNGIYRRYSDDFIIVIPTLCVDELNKTVKEVINEIPGLYMENDKTKFYKHSNYQINDITPDVIPEKEQRKNLINYLGFSFDGKNISIRGKTIGKYFYRMRRKIDGIERNKGITYKGNKINYDKVYDKYSKKGMNRNKGGNFITYVNNCSRIFKDEVKISNIRKYHMQKIAMVIKEKKKKYEDKN